jgi:SAM-dependent methyltransferase
MTENDVAYIRRLVDGRVVSGTALELGAGYGGSTCREIVERAGMAYRASDMTPSPNVDFVADFESDDFLRAFPETARFGCVLVLNVLEHTFEPIRVLDNALRLLEPSGALVVIAPAVWPLHDYPVDCYRFLPDWFERYASSRGLRLDRERFEYVGIGPVGSFVDGEGRHAFPGPAKGGFHRLRSRVVHRLFDTFGRGMAFPPHLGIGAVMRRQPGAGGGAIG